MATSDDPPFLTVGTEVSAKYRGAFCEATIKVAKKLVKCKVSYSKGNSALVSNEVVKGTLKVGSPVEVRQPDGQYLAASIVKLTDQSTYTVVFDDGDERTLKRSSLCLKGGRHFDKSESLDNLPLTDPENFGTPVLHSTKKPSRKRRRCSQSPSRKEEENGKRPCSYPERFPVGKAVFLENDRRRSCWLPAVIVPAHYVMEESDRTPDTICLRSFKDGRFFASTKDELHDFAPDKEPLLSMLEGEIQPMYMCKPAIERAMAYLDTGELPWDMDLFDKTIEHRSATPTDEEETGDEVVAEVEEFNEKLKKFHESKGTPMVRRPTLGQKDLNLFKLYKLVKENGGMEKVTQELKWRSLHLQMGMPNMTNASYAIKQAYKKYLYAFEIHEKGGKGGKQSVKESLGSWTNQRRKRNLEERSSEEREKSVIEKPPAPKMSKVVVKEEDPEEVERSEVMSQNDAKSEMSDQDSSSQAENSSNNGDDCSPHFDGYTHVKLEEGILTSGPYKPGDRIKVHYGKGKNQCLYEAKIIGLEEGEMGRDYLVHYNGWNTRYDEWITEARIAEKVTGPSRATRPQYAKKKANKKKAMQTRASSDGPSGTNVPSPPSSSAPSSRMATPQQPPHSIKRIRKTSESTETTSTPLNSEKLAMPSNYHHKHLAATSTSSCPLTPITTTTSTTGKMLNGGHLPSQQNHHPSSSKSGGSNGKASGRGAKRRRPSQASETPHHQVAVHPSPAVGPQALFAPNVSATSTPNHIPAVTMVPNFVTPVTTPVSSVTPPPPGGHVTDLKRVESDGVCSVQPLPVFSTVAPVRLMTTTASQQPVSLNHKHTPTTTTSSKSNGTNRGGVASGLNGSVCDGSGSALNLGKNDRIIKGHHHHDVKVKRESEERTGGWTTNKNTTPPPVTTAGMREFSPSSIGGLKPEMAHVSGAEILSIFPPHLLHHMHMQPSPIPGLPPPMAAANATPQLPLQQPKHQDSAASALFCSERVPGMMSGDLKPVIQPVRHISAARHTPSPRARPSVPLKKSDVDAAFSNPPESSSYSSSSVPQHPVDSPSSTSQSANELSPSPPCSPIHHPSNSSSKKLHHSSSSSSLSSSLSGSAPASATLLMGKNGVIRPTESTIQEREEAEEARIDMDESSALSRDSPSSTLSDNSSEKEQSPPASEQHHHSSRSKGSQSPDGGKRRRRSYETEEQYEERRKARRAKLNFMVDFTRLPVMTSAEKVVLIEEQMKTIQKKWVELKAEVNDLDRKRRKARKKEREAARLAASQAQAAAAASAGSVSCGGGSAGTGSRCSTSPSSANTTNTTAISTDGGNSGAGRPTPPIAVECR